MKFRCIEGHDIRRRSWFDWRPIAIPVDGLTELKVYYGLAYPDTEYVLIFDDDGEWNGYKIKRFVPIED